MLKVPSSTTANLIAAKALIANEEDWGCGAPDSARARGRPCALEALRIVLGLGSGLASWDADSPERRLLDYAANLMYGLRTWQVNDRIGHAAVMQVYDRAIAMSMEEE